MRYRLSPDSGFLADGKHRCRRGALREFANLIGHRPDDLMMEAVDLAASPGLYRVLSRRPLYPVQQGWIQEDLDTRTPPMP